MIVNVIFRPQEEPRAEIRALSNIIEPEQQKAQEPVLDNELEVGNESLHVKLLNTVSFL